MQHFLNELNVELHNHTRSHDQGHAWLNALPVASLGLRLDNKIFRIAVVLRLGLLLCHPHRCVHCKVEVNDWALTALAVVSTMDAIHAMVL